MPRPIAKRPKIKVRGRIEKKATPGKLPDAPRYAVNRLNMMIKLSPALIMTMIGKHRRGNDSFLIKLALSRKTFWDLLTISEKSPHDNIPAHR
jgi:hypothetical protein